MRLIILPHQLFAIKHIPKYVKSVTIWEHPHYFKTYKYNKKKLLLHRASMRAYYDEIKPYVNVTYCGFNDTLSIPSSGYVYFDPVDKIKMPPRGKQLETPNFLLTKDEYKQYRQRTDKFFLSAFYAWAKQTVDIIPAVKSQDSHNRKKLPHNYKEVKLPPSNKNKYVIEAIKYVNKHFPDNYGNTDNFIFPVNRAIAVKWLQLFIKHKFKKFGDYQDAVSKNSSYLNHSCLSSSINIGLINPMDIIKLLKNIKHIPINSYEGYVRQLFWREYQRYCYLYANLNGNYFGNRKSLTPAWYSGLVGIDPVDECIKRGFDTGYLNHIERLMIVGNAMNLSGISPPQGHRWFMEFSVDSYEWVMYQNVYDMVFYITGGRTMRRPYLGSSNYIKKMSNYKSGVWCDILDNLYHAFIKKHRSKLKGTIYYK